MSNACSPGRSRGRSTVGRRHLAFQVAGLHGRQQEEEGGGGGGRGRRKRAKRSANQWQLTGGLPRSGMGVISAICSTWEPQCQAGIRCTTTSPRLLTHTHTHTHTCAVSQTALTMITMILYVHKHIYWQTHWHTHIIPRAFLIALNSPHFLMPFPLTRSSCLQHESWAHSNSTPPSRFSPSGELQRCAIWFQAPAQLLLKTVGKHQGIPWICGTNSCPVVSARRPAAPSRLPFFPFFKPLLRKGRLAE